MSTLFETAGMLERHAGEIADTAARALLEQHAAIHERFGERALDIWTGHLQQRLLELCAALDAGQNALFISRVDWSRTAMIARDIEPRELDASLVALRDAIGPYLDDDARRAANDCIDAARDRLRRIENRLEESTLDPGQPAGRIALRYIQAVIAGNALPGMSIVLDALDEGLTPRNAILDVLLPAQREVGRLWHVNEISVAEEHMVTVTTQRLMAVIASRVQCAAPHGHTAVAATVTGNVHEIGIRAIAYLLEFDGWRTIYLGPDVPESDIPAASETFSADVILLSLALSSQIPELKRVIDQIRSRTGPQVKIIVGGNGLAGAAELWKEIGADAYGETAERAITLANELVTPMN